MSPQEPIPKLINPDQVITRLKMFPTIKAERFTRFLSLVETKTGETLGVTPVVLKRIFDRKGPVMAEEARAMDFLLQATTANPETWLVLTPEYSLYSTPDKAEPMQFDSSGNVLSGQITVRKSIESAKDLARSSGANIVLSSVCERRQLKSGKSVTFNSTLLLSPTEEIQIRRKAADVQVLQDETWTTVDALFDGDNRLGLTKPDLTPEDQTEIYELTYGSINSTSVKDKAGVQHKIAIIVCHERGRADILEKVPSDIDLLLIPISEGQSDKDILGAAIIAYGESLFIQESIGTRNQSKSLTLVRTNERTQEGGIIRFDSSGEISHALLIKN